MSTDTRDPRRKRFVKQAGNWTTNVLRDLRSLGLRSNRALYLYSAEDVAKIFDAINAEVARTQEMFMPRGEFSLASSAPEPAPATRRSDEARRL
jgi:hypothetical protein